MCSPTARSCAAPPWWRWRCRTAVGSRALLVARGQRGAGEAVARRVQIVRIARDAVIDDLGIFLEREIDAVDGPPLQRRGGGRAICVGGRRFSRHDERHLARDAVQIEIEAVRKIGRASCRERVWMAGWT